MARNGVIRALASASYRTVFLLLVVCVTRGCGGGGRTAGISSMIWKTLPFRPCCNSLSQRPYQGAVYTFHRLREVPELFHSNAGQIRVSCVRQVQQIGHGDRVLVYFRSRATSLCSIKLTIPSSRPVFWQSAARSGSQGCRAKAAAPAQPARSVLDRASSVLG